MAGLVQSGRQALLAQKPEEALAYFQAAAEKNPDYIFRLTSFRESVWTYLGRAQYDTGRLQEARRSFERALSVYQDDYLARLYLGLTLARATNHAEGLKDIRTGLQGLYDWLEYMQRSRPFTAFWDPLRHIRSEIEKDLEMISGKELDWPKLIESGEWVGHEMEEEIDRVRRDERRQFERDEFRRRGLFLGLDFGF